MAWFHLTSSYNSDGQWPPTLPEAPHIVHPGNYTYCFENLLKAELLAGGVDRGRLKTDPARALREVLDGQQRLVLEKARRLLRKGSSEERARAARAAALVECSRDDRAVKRSGLPILYPSEYCVRAEALVEARRLVGGVKIEDSEKP
jgi:hypothetical protein